MTKNTLDLSSGTATKWELRLSGGHDGDRIMLIDATIVEVDVTRPPELDADSLRWSGEVVVRFYLHGEPRMVLSKRSSMEETTDEPEEGFTKCNGLKTRPVTPKLDIVPEGQHK